MDRAARLGYLPRLHKEPLEPMPLHCGKVFAAIALLTVTAFVLWLIVTTWFATEQVDQKIEQEQQGMIEMSGAVQA